MNTDKEPIDVPAVVEADRAHLAQLVSKLTRDLTESRKATEAVQAGAEIERSGLRAELARRADCIVELTMSNSASRDRARRLAREQVQLLRALRALVVQCSVLTLKDDMHPDPEAWMRSIQQAQEVLTLLDIPF